MDNQGILHDLAFRMADIERRVAADTFDMKDFTRIISNSTCLRSIVIMFKLGVEFAYLDKPDYQLMFDLGVDFDDSDNPLKKGKTLEPSDQVRR